MKFLRELCNLMYCDSVVLSSSKNKGNHITVSEVFPVLISIDLDDFISQFTP